MGSFIKKCLVSGGLVLAPVALTVWILKLLILWSQNLADPFIPTTWQTFHLFGYEIPGLGIAITVMIVFSTGLLTQMYLGKKIIALGDRLINKIPFGSGIYNSIKQLIHSFASGGTKNFKQVVLVEPFEKDCGMIGFVTGESDLHSNVLHVFVPTTPNPTTGFLFLLPKEKVIPMNLSVEAAFKLIVSAGTIQN